MGNKSHRIFCQEAQVWILVLKGSGLGKSASAFKGFLEFTESCLFSGSSRPGPLSASASYRGAQHGSGWGCMSPATCTAGPSNFQSSWLFPCKGSVISAAGAVSCVLSCLSYCCRDCYSCHYCWQWWVVASVLACILVLNMSVVACRHWRFTICT